MKYQHQPVATSSGFRANHSGSATPTQMNNQTVRTLKPPRLLSLLTLIVFATSSCRTGSVSSAPTTRWVITDHGAVADGTTLNTKAIQGTIDQCAASGGGECDSRHSNRIKTSPSTVMPIDLCSCVGTLRAACGMALKYQARPMLVRTRAAISQWKPMATAE